MRFDAKVVSLVTYFAILLFNAYVLSLYFDQQLILYTHPRYALFTAIFNAASLVACGVGFLLTAWRISKAPSGEVASGNGAIIGRVPWRPTFALLVAGLVFLAAYALPARTLSSDAAEQRSGNFNSTQVGASGSGTGNTLALFGADTSRLTIADWVSAFNLKTAPSFYEGKKVDAVGFVFHPKGTPQDVFYVSRFRITCCTVDARPLGVPVYSPGWQEKFDEDSWVHVVGNFSKTDQDIAEPAIVTPQSIEPTSQPENPYVT
jgi:putative membrane protein